MGEQGSTELQCSIIATPPFSPSPSLAPLPLPLEDMGRTLFRLFQHPSLAIVKAAGLLMKAIIEVGLPPAGCGGLSTACWVRWAGHRLRGVVGCPPPAGCGGLATTCWVRWAVHRLLDVVGCPPPAGCGTPMMPVSEALLPSTPPTAGGRA